MKILYINDFAHLAGGSSAAAIASARALISVGSDLSFFGGSGQSDHLLKSSYITAPDLVHIYNSGTIAEKLSVGLWNRDAKAAVLLFLKNKISDGSTVIHLHSFTKVLSPSVLRVLRKANLPVVITLHDYFSFCPNGNYFDFPKNKPCSLRPLSFRCCATQCDSRGNAQKIVRLIRAGIMKATLTYGDWFDAAIAVSDLSANIWKSFSTFSSLHVVPNLLPEPNFIPLSKGNSFVYVGRLTRSKGVVSLACATKKAQVPITFVGEGEAHHEVLEANPDAVITGWVRPEKAMDFIRNARALIHPSLWYETFGLVVAEALSMGRPVIVSNRAGASELVKDGVNGLIWNADNFSHLVELLINFSNQDYTQQLSDKGRTLYLKSWISPRKHAEQLLRVYQNALISYQKKRI
jgi:glycosyltransferase involved in cell wall biosynthesis